MRGSTILTTVLTAAVLMQCGPVNAADTVPQAVRTAVGYPGRPPDDRARDAARKPTDMITFAGIKAGDIVADFVPGTGYYTRIFSHLVGPKGHVYPFVPLVAGAAWATRVSIPLRASLLVLVAENLSHLGQGPQAMAVLDDARRELGRHDMADGAVGARFQYELAKVCFQTGNMAGGTKALATAMAFQIGRAHV